MTSAPFTTDSSSWIWSSEGVSRARPDESAYRVRYFRRTFDVAARGATLTVHVSADTRYKLWCNGTLVARGPAKGDVLHQFYDTVDLGALLRPGRNVLAAQVQYQGDVYPHYYEGGASVSQMTACPIFVLEGVLQDAAGSVLENLSTDKKWKVLVDRAYRWVFSPHTSCTGALEEFHAAHFPWGFEQAQFDDSAWPHAHPVAVAYAAGVGNVDSSIPHRLLPRMIAPLEEKGGCRFVEAFRSPSGEDLAAWTGMLNGRGAVTVPANRKAAVLIRADALTTGYPHLQLGGGAGAKVQLTYAERLMDKDEVKTVATDLSYGDVVGQTDTVLVAASCAATASRPRAGSPCHFEPFFLRTFWFVRVDVETAGEPLVIRSLDYTFTAYPFEQLASFECSDAGISAIRDICWRTARLCAHETYEDCPYYEQLQYGGDTQIQAMISYCTAGDATLARQFLYQFDWSRQPSGLTRSRYPSRLPQTIPYWSLHWVMAIADYWRYTGDRATIRDLWPGVQAVMEYFRRQTSANGTIGKLDGWLVADWCPQWNTIEKPGTPPGASGGTAAYDSLMTAAALVDAIAICEAAGEDSAPLRVRLEALRAAAHKVYFDASRGLYSDYPVVAGKGFYSAYTQVWAILAGLPCDAAALAERIVRDKDLCQLTMFSTYFAYRALAAAGRYDLAPELLALWRQMPVWGLSTCPEVPDFARTRSDCHAWSAGPLVEFSREILGVRPAEAGYAAIAIEPKPAGLQFARGRVPLTRLRADEPARFVHVDWRIEHGRFILHAQTPPGPPCTVTLPGGTRREFPAGGEIKLAEDL